MQEPASATPHLGKGKVIFQVFGKPFSESRGAWERCVVAMGGCGLCDGQLGTWALHVCSLPLTLWSPWAPGSPCPCLNPGL